MPDPTPLFSDERRSRSGSGEPPTTEMELEKRLTAVEALLPTLSTKGDVADIRADIHKAIAENARWTHTAMVGMFGAFVLGALGLMFTIWNTSKQAQHPQPSVISQPPIIINVPAAPSGIVAPTAAPSK